MTYITTATSIAEAVREAANLPDRIHFLPAHGELKPIELPLAQVDEGAIYRLCERGKYIAEFDNGPTSPLPSIKYTPTDYGWELDRSFLKEIPPAPEWNGHSIEHLSEVFGWNQ